jgi:hypothetical protein
MDSNMVPKVIITELRKYRLKGWGNTDFAISERLNTNFQATKVGSLGHRVGGIAIASEAGLMEVLIMI